MSTTPTGVAATTATEDGEAAFLARFLPEGDTDAGNQPSDKGTDEPRKKKPVVEDEPETEADDTTETDETSEETPEDEADEGDDEKPAKKRYTDDDGETYTKIKIGEEEHEVPVSQLKRLFGQEASITQKGQAVAAKAKEVEAQGTQYATGLQAMLARAVERAQPYANLDFLALSRDPNVTSEQLAALRTEAQERIQDAQFLHQELGNFTAARQQQQHAALVEQAKSTVKVLADPASPLHIEGWDQKVYNDIRNFAVEVGLAPEIANNLVDAPALKILHMAMQFKAGQSKVVTTKVNKTVKKVVKTSKPMSTSVRTGKGDDAKKALARLRSSGSQDDAANAFLARFSTDED